MDQPENIYETGKYLEDNPDWHAQDSPWKAGQILMMIETHDLQPQSVAEVGCGAGAILCQLQDQLSPATEFHGFEVSPQAYNLAVQRQRPRLHFHLQDILEDERVFDLLLVIDVFEHVEDYMGFLRKLSSKATHVIFHIPLDLSVQTIARSSALMKTRRSVGHLHSFTEETAIATIRDTGYQVVDYFLTDRSEAGGGGLKRKLAGFPRRFVGAFSKSTASRLLGGFSLLVLAKGA